MSTSSLAETVASLIQQQGANAARAREQAGAVWGGAIRDIGQTVAQTVRDVGATRKADKLQTIIAKQPRVDLGDGVMGYDMAGLHDAITKAGGDPTTTLQAIAPLNASLQQMHAARMNAVKTGALSLIASGNDPTLAHNFLDTLEHNQAFSKDQIKSYRDFIDADPGNVAKLTAYFAGPQKVEEARPGSSARNPITGVIVPNSQAPAAPPKPGEGQHVVNGQLIGSDGQPIGAAVPLQEAPDQKALREAQLREIDAKLNGTIPMSPKDKAKLELQRAHLRLEQQKAIDAKADKTDLTPEGLDAAAMLFAKTGVLPALGMGDKTTRKSIINRAAALMPGLDVATAKADFEANRKSLDNVTGTLDTLESFSKAASKNLDQFVKLADKLPDSGIPWMNTPLRQLNDKLVGAEWAPAVNAARAVATREVARITGDPKLKGVLSDAARHEVDALVPGDITFAQLKRVIPILKMDMENVHSSLNEQKTAIQGRIKLGAQTPPAAAPAAAEPAAPALTPGLQRLGAR